MNFLTRRSGPIRADAQCLSDRNLFLEAIESAFACHVEGLRIPQRLATKNTPGTKLHWEKAAAESSFVCSVIFGEPNVIFNESSVEQRCFETSSYTKITVPE